MNTPFIIITGFGTVPSAVEAMKLGASDYMGKPLSSPDELRVLVRKALAGRQTEDERDLLREDAAVRFSYQFRGRRAIRRWFALRTSPQSRPRPTPPF